jgi:cytidyltransferase-like protein
MTQALCHGCFEILHPAHIRHLTAARRMADRLVVTITADEFIHKGPGRPVMKESYRAEMLIALRVVDEVAIIEDATGVPGILRYRPDFYCKGSEYAGPDSTGRLELERAAVESYGGKLVILPDGIRFSSGKIVTGSMWYERLKEQGYEHEVAHVQWWPHPIIVSTASPIREGKSDA